MIFPLPLLVTSQVGWCQPGCFPNKAIWLVPSLLSQESSQQLATWAYSRNGPPFESEHPIWGLWSSTQAAPHGDTTEGAHHYLEPQVLGAFPRSLWAWMRLREYSLPLWGVRGSAHFFGMGWSVSVCLPSIWVSGMVAYLPWTYMSRLMVLLIKVVPENVLTYDMLSTPAVMYEKACCVLNNALAFTWRCAKNKMQTAPHSEMG